MTSTLGVIPPKKKKEEYSGKRITSTGVTGDERSQ